MTSSIQKTTSNRPNWDLYAGALLLLVGFFQAMQWPLSPKFLDIYYHLSVMKGFADAGGYVTRAFWEYAPGGRPHLYPPFLHVIMLVFYKAGLSAIDVGRLIDVTSYPLLLCVYWAVVRKVYSDKTAFIALLLFSSVYSVLLASVTLSAFNLSAIFLLLILAKTHARRYVQAGLLLGISFYTHTYAAGLSVLFLVLYGLGKKTQLKGLLTTIAIGVGLALPFLIHQFQMREFFTLVSKDLKESSLLEVDILIYVLAAYGLWMCRQKAFFKHAWPAISLWLAFAPMLATHPVRFYFGHGLMGLVLLGALSFDKLTERIPKFIWVIPFLAVCLGPVFHWNFETKSGGLRWADRSLVRYLLPDPYQESRSNGFTIFFEEPYQEMKEVIQANSEKGDIIWTDFSYTAGILAVLSDRVTSCAMLAEIKPYEARHRIQDAKIIIWFKNANLQPMEGMAAAVNKYDLRLLKEVEMAYLYLNPQPSSPLNIPDPFLPTWCLFLLFAGLLFASFYPKPRKSPSHI